MKVLYDYQVFDAQRIGGISRYFYKLFDEFQNNDLVKWELPIKYSNNVYLKDINQFKNLPVKDTKEFLPGREFRGKQFLYRLKNKLVTPIAKQQTEKNRLESINEITRGDFDIFHPTYYDDYFLDYIGEKPFVLTIYDCIHQIFPEFLLYVIDKNQLMLDKASRIIAISESTKRDLVNLFTIDENKIDVTLLANSLNDEKPHVTGSFNFEIPEKYFLFVGGRDEYKNFMFFIQVFSALAKIEKNIHVICTGLKFNTAELYLFKKTNLEGRVHQTFVNDQQLSFLYKNAVAFVFPSLYEGFGLPVLEAFYYGCPVVVSRNSSLVEISGDAAILFNPKEPESMMSALKTILYNKSLRESKILSGIEQEKKFSWRKTAEQTKLCYERVLNN